VTPTLRSVLLRARNARGSTHFAYRRAVRARFDGRESHARKVLARSVFALFIGRVVAPLLLSERATTCFRARRNASLTRILNARLSVASGISELRDENREQKRGGGLWHIPTDT